MPDHLLSWAAALIFVMPVGGAALATPDNRPAQAEAPDEYGPVCRVTQVPASGELANDALKTRLRRDGRIEFRPGGAGYVHRDGALQMKTPWWRLRRGQLTIEGRRLDATAPPMRSDIPAGYSPLGFQPVGLIFPTPGCWQVTGRLGDASLTFVLLVEKVADGPCSKLDTEPNEAIGAAGIASWNEDVYAVLDTGTRLARLNSSRSYSGGIQGASTVQMLIAYGKADTAVFVGQERLDGSINGVKGTFIMQHQGTIDGGVARSTWSIAATTGADIVGRGSFTGTRERACYSFVPTGDAGGE